MGDRVPLTRREVVLAALASAGENANFTPVQVQKLFFLIDREAARLLNGPHFAFRAYDYGPFDSAVYDQLMLLKFEANLEIMGGGQYRLYTLTPDGFAEGQRIVSKLPTEAAKFLAAAAEWVRRLSFQQLVAAIYRAYPDMKVNSIFRE